MKKEIRNGIIIGGIIGLILSLVIGSIDNPFWVDYTFSKSLYNLIAPIFFITLISIILGGILSLVKVKYGISGLVVGILIIILLLGIFRVLEPLEGKNIYNKPITRYFCNHIQGNFLKMRDCEENSPNIYYRMINTKECIDSKGNFVSVGTVIGGYQYWNGKIEEYYDTEYEKGTCDKVKIKEDPQINSKCICTTSF